MNITSSSSWRIVVSSFGSQTSAFPGEYRFELRLFAGVKAAAMPKAKQITVGATALSFLEGRILAGYITVAHNYVGMRVGLP